MNAASRWTQTWSHLVVPPPAGLVDELVSAYSEPHRAYHTLQHLTECFEHLDSCPIEPEDRAALELAIWFHDAIYDTRANDNEARSAEWSRDSLSSLGASLLARLEALILVTQHNAQPQSEDEKLLLDVDLSILGAPESRFAEYENQVRREFEWVPEDGYRQARARILQEFNDRAVLYHTTHFRSQLEPRARENLTRSIEALRA